MIESLFIEYIDKYFKAVVGKVTELINGKKTEQQLLHKTMLQEEYSADLTWGSTELNTSIVAADVVSMDSSLPLKRRDKIASATGSIPKMGIKFRKGEKTISDINVMKARGADESVIASKIFNEVSKAIKGIDVRKEIMFQQALSTGEALVNDPDNVGTGIRVKFGYKDENTFHATVAEWGKAGYMPQDDLNQLFSKASEDGNSIGSVMMSKKYFNLLRSSEQGKVLAANYKNQVYSSTANLPVPSRETMLEALGDEYGVTFQIVDSSFRIEHPDGTQESVHPWEEANVVALPSAQVGRLVYGTLAEETNPVNGVTYQKSGTHTLVAEFAKTDPLEEFTTAQALAIPVIDGVDSIYVLHADAINKTSLTANPEGLTLTKAAGSKAFDVHADSDVTKLTVASDQTWAKASISGSKVTVKVEANTGAERTANITVTDENSQTVTVVATQQAGA